MKQIQISGHARFEMQRRGVNEAVVEAVVRNPGQVLPAKKGRQVYQTKLGATNKLLLRVVVNEDATAYHVITSYKTSKVAKYWKQP
jgi:hypothetical protein